MGSDILLVDKQSGITSFDVIRILRRKLGIRKMGHAGTLDPLATGLMIIGVESGTKQLAGLIGLDKEYIAEIRLGERRTTGDLEGEIVEEKGVGGEAAEIFRRKISAAVASLAGELALPVSAYSAIKQGGVPMYKKARLARKQGVEIEDLPIRKMVVREVELLGIAIGDDKAVVTVRFVVSSGTYIRSLGEELGRRLGYPACLQSLRRTKVGEFRVEEAVKITSELSSGR